MKTKLNTVIGTALLCVVSIIGLHAQGTAFTYQGRLTDNPDGSGANGSYDLRFTIYDLAAGGTAIANPQTNSAVVISNGLFTVTLDFSNQFPGADRWLEIGVRTNNPANPTSFVTLSPRQKLTPTPYAITAGNVVSGGLPATYSSAVNFNNAANSFTGSGAGLTSLNASGLSSGTVSDARLNTDVALLDRNQTFTGNQTFAGHVNLPSPVATIYSGGTTVLHSDFNNANFFAGRGAGNLIVSGTANTGVGDDALISDLGGGGNTGNGFEALYDNTGGNNNTASGAFALQANTSSSDNTADGYAALAANTSGYENTAVGYDSLNLNHSGYDNTAVGVNALTANVDGDHNVAVGAYALYASTNGISNTAIGANALRANTSGGLNAADGSQSLSANTTGSYNTAHGCQALFDNISGSYNTASGIKALYDNIGGNNNTASGANALYSNLIGYDNTADGYDALFGNTNGYENAAVGDSALASNTSGEENTAEGYAALYLNTTGFRNTASGAQALLFNRDGIYNTAAGYQALYSSTNGNYNMANGVQALYSNTTGSENTASGAFALFYNISGNYNTADGENALLYNTLGFNNTAIGDWALLDNTSGFYNTALGNEALVDNTNGYRDTAIGNEALYYSTSGFENIALGDMAGYYVTTGNYNIEIGSEGSATDNNVIRIGTQGGQAQTFIAGIYGATAASGVPVYVTSSGQLGTLTSSKRFKQDIHKMGDASDALYSLKPVTFQYKPGIDPAGTPEFGLVAEQVQKVDPDLVVLDKTGRPYTVRYQAVNAMLLNEFLKEHHTVQEQGTEIQQLRHAVAQLKDLVNQMAEGKKGAAQ